MNLNLFRLHDTIQENPEYAGYIIPPPPPRPDFDASREKLRKLGDAEGKTTSIFGFWYRPSNVYMRRYEVNHIKNFLYF